MSCGAWTPSARICQRVGMTTQVADDPCSRRSGDPEIVLADLFRAGGLCVGINRDPYVSQADPRVARATAATFPLTPLLKRLSIQFRDGVRWRKFVWNCDSQSAFPVPKCEAQRASLSRSGRSRPVALCGEAGILELVQRSGAQGSVWRRS